MIPGLGAAVRVGKGLQERKHIESRIEELEKLFSTPATTHYKGMQRFEVATALCDAKLGLAIDGAGNQSRAETVEEYLSALKREYDMVLEEASSASATKAEIYALGLALKEVALSFDEVSEEFRSTQVERLAELSAESERVRRASADVFDEFTRTAADAIKRLDSTNHSTLAELTRKVDTWLAEQEREQQDHLRGFDRLLTEHIDEFKAEMAELRARVAETVADHHHQCEAATAEVRADMAASMQTLKRVGTLAAIVVLAMAVLVGQLLGS